MDRERFRIYLQDHNAGAQIGTDLARRLAANNSGSEFDAPLDRIATEIRQDCMELRQIMIHFEVQPDRMKTSAARLGEKLGRLKMNGQLTGYSPLSRLLEIETLLLGVTGKLCLWRTLAHVLDESDPLQQQLIHLAERAERQTNELETLRRRAAGMAFEYTADRSLEKAAQSKVTA